VAEQPAVQRCRARVLSPKLRVAARQYRAEISRLNPASFSLQNPQNTWLYGPMILANGKCVAMRAVRPADPSPPDHRLILPMPKQPG